MTAVDPRHILTTGGISGVWDASSDYVLMTEQLQELLAKLETDSPDGADDDDSDDPTSDSDSGEG